MDKQGLENRLRELKGQQSAHFQKKKADRDADALVAVRQEMNDIKAKLAAAYRGREVPAEDAS